MPTPCPKCSFDAKNAWECPACGHPMEEEPELDLSRGLTHVVLELAVEEDPLIARAMDLLLTLEQVAPEIAAWRGLPAEVRGPMPPIAPAKEQIVAQLLVDMQLVSEQMAQREETEPPVH